MIAGSLKKITYPTGGYSLFNFEANRYHKTAEPPIETPGHYETTTFNASVAQNMIIHVEDTVDNTLGGAFPSVLHITVDNYYRGMEATDSYLPRFCIYELKADGTTSLAYSWNAYDDKTKSNYILYPSTGTESLTYDSEINDGNFLPRKKLKFVCEVVCLRGSCPTFPLKTRMTVSYEYKRYYPPYTPPTPTTQYAIAGGLRIKEIINYDERGTQLSMKKYTYGKTAIIDNKEQEISSGVLISLPKYSSVNRQGYLCGNFYDEDGLQICNSLQVLVGTFTSAPVAVLGVTQGGYVGYEKVTERLSYDDRAGKTDYYYSNAKDVVNNPNVNSVFSKYGNWPLYLPNIDKSYARGLLLQKDIFANYGTENKLIEQEMNTYNLNDTYDSPNLLSNSYLKVRRMGDSLKSCCGRQIPPQDAQDNNRVYEFEYAYYQSISPWVTLASKTILKDGLTQVINYTYNDKNMSVAKQASVNSKGENIATITKYPIDKVQKGEDPKGVYQKMIDRNMITAVVEQQEIKNNVPVTTTTVSYKDWFGNKALLKPDTVLVSFPSAGVASSIVTVCSDFIRSCTSAIISSIFHFSNFPVFIH